MSLFGDKSYRLQSNNRHLLNVQDESYYVELGTVELMLLNRLLSGAELDLQDIIYPPLALEGIGVISDFEGVEEIDLQLMYLEHLRRKQATNKFFLTCGLINYQDSEQLDIYAPLVLIPVDIYFNKRKIALASEPIVNLLLLKSLMSEGDYNSIANPKLSSIYQIDRFCQDIANLLNLSYGVENYLTFACIEYADFNIKKDFFGVERSLLETSDYHILESYYRNINGILPTNIDQKYALLRYDEGESFVINGRIGSGKTYTVLNMICDAIAKNRRILYVSNDLDRISDLNHYLKTLSLDGFVYNLTHYSLKYPEVEVFLPQITNESFDNNFIKTFKDYGTMLSTKIHGFTVQNILQQLVELIARWGKIEPIEVEELLEVHEVEMVYQTLQAIEKALETVDPFAQNCWGSVENFYDNSHVQEIQASAKDFAKAQNDLQNYLEKICSKYHLVIPKNIRDSHRLLQDLNYFIKAAPPLCWADSFKLEDAHQALVSLSIYIDKQKELDNKFSRFVHSNYKNGMAKQWINDIQYTHLTRNNGDVIDKMFAEVDQINLLLERLTPHQKQIHALNSQLCLLFDVKELNQSHYKLISLLLSLYQDHNIQTEWIRNIVQFNTQLTAFTAKFNQYYEDFYLLHKKLLPYFVHDATLNYQNMQVLIASKSFERNIKRYLNKEALRVTKRSVDDIYQEVTKYVECGAHLNEMVGNDILYNHLSSESQWADYQALLNCYWQLNGTEQRLLRNLWQKMYLSKTSNPPSTIGLFKNFMEEGYYFDGVIEHLRVYKINVCGDNIIERINNMQEWVGYLKSFVTIESKIRQTLNQQTITITKTLLDDFVYMDNEKITIDEIVVSRASKYQALLGELYQGFDTDCSVVMKLLSYFEDFASRVAEDGNLEEILKKRPLNALISEYYTFDKFYDAWYGQYRRFNRFFRGGLGFFMECSFAQGTRYISEYVTKANQLPNIILIIQALKDLQKMYLTNLCDGIRNSEYEKNISIRFLYSILEKYYQLFLNTPGVHITPPDVLNAFEQYRLLERDYCTGNIEKLQKLAKQNEKRARIRPNSLKFNDYNGLVEYYDYSKQVFLADLNIFNSNLNLANFDLVIIDDGHLTTSNKYYRLFEAKQAVVLGDSNFQTSVSNTLMIRMPQSAVINFKQRYLPMGSYFNNPWSVLNQYLDVNRMAPHVTPINNIMDFCAMVVDHFEKKPNNVINVAIDDNTTRRLVYAGIIHCLEQTVSCNSIMDILNYTIRIVSVSNEDSRYVNDIFIYYNDLMKYDHVRRELIFKNFTIVKDRVEIVYLTTNSVADDALIEKELQSLIGKNNNCGGNVSEISNLMIEQLKAAGYRAKAGFGLFEFVVTVNRKIHAFIIDGMHNLGEFSILDRYKYYHDEYIRFGWDVHFLFLSELHNDYDGQMKQIKQLLGDTNEYGE